MIRFTISNACSATVLSLEVCVYAKLCYGSLPTGDPVHRQRIQEGQDMDEEVEAEQTFLSDPTRNGRLVQHGWQPHQAGSDVGAARVQSSETRKETELDRFKILVNAVI